MSSHTRSRVQPGVPTGGQFATESKVEPALSLTTPAVVAEEMDASGWNESMYDSDDPFGADLIEAELTEVAALKTGDHVDLEAAIHQFHPDDLVGDPSDAFEVVAEPQIEAGDVHLRTDRVSLTVPSGYVVPFAGAATIATAMGWDDEERSDELATEDDDDARRSGMVSIDDMTTEQRAAFDGVHRHAYDYADAHLGSVDFPDRDAAEEFASWAAQQFAANDYDAEGLSWSRQAPRFGEHRRRTRASAAVRAQFDDPRDQRLVEALISEHGRPVGVGRNRASKDEVRDLRDLLGRMRQAGFVVDEIATIGGGRALRVSDQQEPAPGA